MIASRPFFQRQLFQRVAGQGALLFGGFATAQGFSFLRNAMLGYWLSKGDFGVAAAVVVMLQLVEALSDAGADRLLVQAPDGDDPRMLQTAHAILLGRGLATAIVLFAIAGPVSDYLRLAAHRELFEAIAVVPLIKGFTHLDQRRRQRHFQNRDFVMTEVIAQGAALAALPALLWLSIAPVVVVWAALIQAIMTVAVSHALAGVRWSLSADAARLRRFLAFGWPIWASAIPLAIVFQADRIVVARWLGIEALAGYTAAFMVTMVPGLVAARIGHSLMLPLLTEMRDNRPAFINRYRLLIEATVLIAAAYLAVFLVAGGKALALAFGPSYRGLHEIVGLLAIMWTVRMVQAVPGMALMAMGETRPLLWAAIVRASVLPLVVGAASLGYGLAGIAAVGTIGELASLAFVSLAAGRTLPGLGWMTFARTLLLLPVAAIAALAGATLPSGMPGVEAGAIGLAVATACVCVGCLVQPALRTLVLGVLPLRQA